MYNFKRLHPVYLNDLIRIGSESDGGYVISKQQVQKTNLLLSFGISDNWTFEEDFLKKNEECKLNSEERCMLYAFDRSVTPFGIFRGLLYQMAGVIIFALCFNFKRVKFHSRMCYYSVNSMFHKSRDEFNNFFKEEHHVFIPKYLGQKDDKTFVRFDTFLTKLPDKPNDLSIFIKMDIEGWEYKTLSQILPFVDKVNGVIVEFHKLHICGKEFDDVIDLLSGHFYIAHVHANNTCGLIEGTDLPILLEITFINKNLVPDSNMRSTQKYPIEGLDFPNIKKRNDIPLNFY